MSRWRRRKDAREEEQAGKCAREQVSNLAPAKSRFLLMGRLSASKSDCQYVLGRTLVLVKQGCGPFVCPSVGCYSSRVAYRRMARAALAA